MSKKHIILIKKVKQAKSFFNEEPKEIKSYGKYVGNLVARIAKQYKDDAEALEECLLKSLGRVLLYQFLPELFRVKKEIIETRAINPKTGRMKTFKKVIEIKTVKEDVIADLCAGNKFANRYFRYIKHEILYNEQKTKTVGVNAPYAGEATNAMRGKQQKDNQKYLESKFIRIKGKLTALSEIVKSAHSLSSEIYTEAKGYERLAEKKGFTWLFITITLPARFHPNPTKGKSAWDGSSALEAKKWFQAINRNMQKEIGRKEGASTHLKFGINTAFGQRVIEPHKDGSPHWHIMLYCDPLLAEDYKNLFNRFFGHINESKHAVKIVEKGINENGNKLPEDKISKGAGYIYKYILKFAGLEDVNTIQTQGQAGEKEIEEAVGNIERVGAWRSAIGARSFEPIGVKGKKTLYRNLRRIQNTENNLELEIEVDHEAINEVMSKKIKFKENEINGLEIYITEEELESRVEEIIKEIRKKMKEVAKQFLIFQEVKRKASEKDKDNKNCVKYDEFIMEAELLEYENIYTEETDEITGKIHKSEKGLKVGFITYIFKKYEETKKTASKLAASVAQDDFEGSQNVVATLVYNSPRATQPGFAGCCAKEKAIFEHNEININKTKRTGYEALEAALEHQERKAGQIHQEEKESPN